MILGVAQWLSEKLGWDVLLIRIAFLVAFFVYGTGVGLYLILWFVKVLSK